MTPIMPSYNEFRLIMLPYVRPDMTEREMQLLYSLLESAVKTK